MSKSIQVTASILCADFTRLGDQIKKCEESGIDMIHVDVMDGFFVPNITIGPVIVESIRPLTKLPIDVHLMIENPGRYIDHFADAGADIIAVHAECYGPRKEDCQVFDQYPKEVDSVDIDQVRVDIHRIKAKGKKAFVAFNPGTPVCLGSLVKDLDGVLMMSVNPGFSKQKFMPMVLPKIQQLREQFDGDIMIDGGINALTAPEAVKAGANILATASYFFGAEKPKDVVKSLQALQ